MDHHATAVPGYRTEASPWRKTAIVSAGIAAVELVVLVVIALAFIAKPLADDGKPASAESKSSVKSSAQTEATSARAPAQKTPTAVEAELPRAKTAVLVLNGNGMAGAASEAASRVQALRYPIAGVADASRRDFPRTIVMYRPGFEGEAQRLARDLGLELRRAVPLDGMRPGDLGNAKLALILGG